MGVIVRRLGRPRRARENFRCTWEHLGVLTTSLGKSGGAWHPPGRDDDKPRTAGTSSWSTLTDSGGVWTNKIFFVNAAGAPGDFSYYLWFYNCWNSRIQFVFSSMYLDCYPSTDGISGLAAAGGWEPFNVRWTMTIERPPRYTPWPWSNEYGDEHGGGNWDDLHIHSDAHTRVQFGMHSEMVM